MPFATNAPTIKDMLAAVDAGTATLAEVAVVANNRLAREGKADGWYARYSALATKCAAGEAVVVADVFPAKPATVAVNPLRDDLPVAPVAPAVPGLESAHRRGPRGSAERDHGASRGLRKQADPRQRVSYTKRPPA